MRLKPFTCKSDDNDVKVKLVISNYHHHTNYISTAGRVNRAGVRRGGGTPYRLCAGLAHNNFDPFV